MTWIDLVWPMMSAACLTLAMIHSLIWVRRREHRNNLLFAVVCASAAAIAILELLGMRADTPDRYATIVRWGHVPYAVMIICLAGFVSMHFNAGRRWLLHSVIVARVGTIFANFLTGINLNFISLDSVNRVRVWGGEVISTPVGVANPWMLLGQLSLLLLVLLMVDVIVTVWRRNGADERRKVTIVCGSIFTFLIFSDVWFLSVVHGFINAPMTMTPVFLPILLATSYELSSDVLRVPQLEQNLASSQSSLRESERRLDQAVRAAELGVWSWDRDQSRLWISEKGRNILGLPPEGPVHLAQLRADLSAEERDRIEQALRDAAAAGGEYRCENRLPKPDGRTRWIATRGNVEFDADARPCKISGVFVDVTERKLAEDKFRAVIEAAPTAMLVLDSAGRIVLSNRQSENIFGYSRGDLANMDMGILVPSERGVPPLPDSRSDEPRPAFVTGVQCKGRRRDGSEVPLEMAFSSIHSESGPLQLTCITDITERRRMERDAALQRDELAHLSRVSMLAELSGSLAHELTQPLTSILSYAQAAELYAVVEPPNMTGISACLASIVDNDKRAGEVIRRLRAMLRKETIEFTALDINQVVHEVLRIIRADLLNRDVALDLELDATVAPILGDRVQLQQVLLNLIMNGSDAMAGLEGPRRLSVRTIRTAQGVEVAVTDHGKGIAPDDLRRIFLPFVSSKSDGMGLGLAVCTSIVEAHQGRLWASNNSDAGATVQFSLPAMAPT